MKLHILFLLVTHLQCWHLASAPEFYDNKNISEIHSKNVVGSLIYTPLVVRLVQEFRTRRKRFCRSHRRFGHRPNRRRHPHRRHHRRRKCRRRPQPVAPMQPAVTPEPPQPSTTEAPEPAKPVEEHQPEATSESNTSAEPEEHKVPEDGKGAEELGQGSDAHAEANEPDSDRSQEPVDEGDDAEHTTSRLQSMECWCAVERCHCATAVIYDVCVKISAVGFMFTERCHPSHTTGFKTYNCESDRYNESSSSSALGRCPFDDHQSCPECARRMSMECWCDDTNYCLCGSKNDQQRRFSCIYNDERINNTGWIGDKSTNSA